MTSEVSPFVKTIEELKDAGPTQLVGQLNRVFLAIGSLDVQGAAAAYQTLSFIGKSSADLDVKDVVQALSDAVVHRMVYLATETERTQVFVSDRERRRNFFAQIVGSEFKERCKT